MFQQVLLEMLRCSIYVVGVPVGVLDVVGLLVVALLLAVGFAAGFLSRDYLSRRRRAHYLKYRTTRD